MFYVTKLIGGQPRHYLYEAFRDKKSRKPRRRLVAYLGSQKTLEERCRFIGIGLMDAKQKESALRSVLEPSLAELRREGLCPSWDEIEEMGARERRITFFLAGAFAASKAIGPLRKKIARMESTLQRLREILPRVRTVKK